MHPHLLTEVRVAPARTAARSWPRARRQLRTTSVETRCAGITTHLGRDGAAPADRSARAAPPRVSGWPRPASARTKFAIRRRRRQCPGRRRPALSVRAAPAVRRRRPAVEQGVGDGGAGQRHARVLGSGGAAGRAETGGSPTHGARGSLTVGLGGGQGGTPGPGRRRGLPGHAQRAPKAAFRQGRRAPPAAAGGAGRAPATRTAGAPPQRWGTAYFLPWLATASAAAFAATGSR